MINSNKYAAFLAAVAAIIAGAPNVGNAADNSLNSADNILPEMIVSEISPGSELMFSSPQPTPKSTITKAGLNLFGGPAQTSMYAPLDLVPSVIVESPDPYGLSTNRNINIRGKTDFHMTKNVEGLPLTGIVGSVDLFDLENIKQVDVYRGGVPSNVGLGISNATGVIDQRLLAPQDKFGFSGKQSFGSFDFRRTFVRVDTGNLSESGTKIFMSASTIAADKWTGTGDQSRNNAMFGVSQQLGDRIKVDFNVVYNKFEGNIYRALNYGQTQTLQSTYKFDYNTSLTGVAATDVNYYNFNRVKYENYGALANVEVKLAEGHNLVFKPYYSKNNGVQYSASGSNVQIWNQENDNVGGVLEYKGRYGTSTDLIAGYWLQSMAPPPPPTDQTKYTVTANGTLAFTGWATLAKIDNFIANSPYFQVTQTIGKTVVSGGVRYMDLGTPKMQYYNTAGLPNVSYDAVWAYNPTLDTNAAVPGKHYREFLPNLGIQHAFNTEWSTSASYGRKFGRPDWGPQASNFISNEAAFLAKGITLQRLVNLVKPELSDTIDLSVRYESRGLTVIPTLFAAKNQNRQVLVIDPTLGGTLAYYQGTAKTTQRGVELEVGYQIDKSLSIFGSGTLASATYDEDTPTLSGGAALSTKGKQIPNAPKTMLKGGFAYRRGDLAMSPVVRYIGQRYGDSAQTKPVDGYTVFDFNASYDLSRDVRLGMAVLNLFDRRYISVISPNDSNLNAATSYYAGAPRTVAITLGAKF